MFKKILDSMAIKANTLQTRAGREYFFGYKSKHNERDRKLKFIAEQKFTEDHPEFMIGHPTGDWDGYVQYRKGYEKWCILIENHSSVKEYYYKLIDDKSVDEINYALVHQQDIPTISNLLTDKFKWEMYLDFYPTSFKIMYASIWLNWVMTQLNDSEDSIKKKKEREAVINYISTTFTSYGQVNDDLIFSIQQLPHVTQVLFMADALNKLKLPKRLEKFEWKPITDADVEFSLGYPENRYEYSFWIDIFSRKFAAFAGIYDVDIENFYSLSN